MSRRSASSAYIFVHDMPWWVSVISSGAFSGVAQAVAPHLMQNNQVIASFMRALGRIPWSGALVFPQMAALSLFGQLPSPDRSPAPAQPTRVADASFPGCLHYPVCKGSRSL